MNKKFLAKLLIFCMIFTMLPMTAFGADVTQKVGDATYYITADVDGELTVGTTVTAQATVGTANAYYTVGEDTTRHQVTVGTITYASTGTNKDLVKVNSETGLIELASAATVETVTDTTEVAIVAAVEVTATNSKPTVLTNVPVGTVTINPAAVKGVTSVTIDQDDVTLKVGETAQLTVTVVADEGVSDAVTWTPGNDEVATVDASGKVTAVAVGTTTITATSTVDATKSDEITVTVNPANSTDPEVTGITVNTTGLVMNPGDTEELTAEVTGNKYLEDKTVEWTSSDDEVATVSANGTVTAVAEGTATITAAANADKTKTATVSVEVTNETIYFLTGDTTTIALKMGEKVSADLPTTKLTDKANKDVTFNYTVNWTIDESVAKIDGTKVVAVAVGETALNSGTTVAVDEGTVKVSKALVVPVTVAKAADGNDPNQPGEDEEEPSTELAPADPTIPEELVTTGMTDKQKEVAEAAQDLLTSATVDASKAITPKMVNGSLTINGVVVANKSAIDKFIKNNFSGVSEEDITISVVPFLSIKVNAPTISAGEVSVLNYEIKLKADIKFSATTSNKTVTFDTIDVDTVGKNVDISLPLPMDYVSEKAVNAGEMWVVHASKDKIKAALTDNVIKFTNKFGFSVFEAYVDGTEPDLTENEGGNGGGFAGGGGGSSSNVSIATNITGGKVTVSPSRPVRGQIVTIHVKPIDGYKLESITITDVNKNDITASVDLKKVDDETYTFVMPAGKVTITPKFVKIDGDEEKPTTNVNKRFSDVAADAWYAEYINYVAENGLMNGYEDGRFGPNDQTVRAQIVTVLYRLEGEPAVQNASPFSDVAAGGQYYSSAVAWAARYNIVNGYEDGRFAPNDNVTREQIAAILYRYANYKEIDTTLAGDISTFSDAARVSGWANSAIAWAVGEGLMNGDNGALRPQGNTTRAEMAALLMRFCENIVK